ncbi:MAG: glutamate ligase domain-containing protein [Ruminococcus sp.]
MAILVHQLLPLRTFDSGIHNVENYLAAISAVWGEVSTDVIVQVAKTFGGVEHRIEFVRERKGVKWYNDSIATSPTRVLAGLNSFQTKLTVIMGGYDKKIPFEPMAETVCDKVKTVILMGVTARKLKLPFVVQRIIRKDIRSFYTLKPWKKPFRQQTRLQNQATL